MIRLFAAALFAIVIVSPSAISFTHPSASIFLPHTNTNHRRSSSRQHGDGRPAASIDADRFRDITPIKSHHQGTEPSPPPLPMSSQDTSWGRPPYLALLTEPDACTSLQRVEETIRAIEQATMDGGVTLVVVRVVDDSSNETSLNKWTLLKNLADMKQRQRGGFLLIVNDDVDIVVRALTQNIAVDGVHVKEHNAHLIPSIRQKLEHATKTSSSSNPLNENEQNHSGNIIIGTSCHSLQSATTSYQLSPRGPDYLFVGTCYLTQSHPEKTSLDQLEGPSLPGIIKRATKTMPQSPPLSPQPIILAIGGIDEQNCHEPVSLGADGVATIRTVMQASDPTQTVHRMKKAMQHNDAE
mmetsp:Transcript_24237/g.52280  ORF Transcript_24237/g.52280 Transcript_24237/m.52280 type:complete len:354 (+) Transcript_24237:75-1136(+)